MENFYQVTSYVGALAICIIVIMFLHNAGKNENFEKYNSYLEKK